MNGWTDFRPLATNLRCEPTNLTNTKPFTKNPPVPLFLFWQVVFSGKNLAIGKLNLTKLYLDLDDWENSGENVVYFVVEEDGYPKIPRYGGIWVLIYVGNLATYWQVVMDKLSWKQNKHQ